jgi:OmcA/MtrC family decaheme c-type cytochrome
MLISRYLTVLRFGLLALMVAVLVGCGNDDDDDDDGDGTPPPSADLSALVAQAKPEQCALCHVANSPAVSNTGPGHQAVYAMYADASRFTLTIDSVSSVPNANGTFTSTLTFTAKKDGVGLASAAAVAGLAQKTFYAVKYDSATRQFTPSFSYAGGTTAGNYTPTATPGQFQVKATAASFAPENSNAQVYAYIGDGVLDTEGMTLYDDVANAGKAYGDAATYQSAANVSACETCHGKPYRKHGVRAAAVDGLADFGACKDCHFDTRNGGHVDWQLLEDDPARFAELEAAAEACPDTTCDTISENMTAEEKAKYAYKANVMNDVHMSHNMEFPYPQTMQSCTTCHAGQLGDTAANDIFADSKFVASTCVSCHSVEGLKTKMTANAATEIIHGGFIAKMDDPAQRDTVVCTTCHGKDVRTAPTFATMHKSGYDPKIYATDGTRYSDTFVVTVDSATYDAATHMLDIKFSASGAHGGLSATNITPTVLIGLYGYDTKDFIVAAHGRDDGVNRNLEHVWGDGNPRFTDVSASGGSWEVKADLSMWADKLAANADGLVVVRRAEVAVMPSLSDANNTVLGLNAPSRTFNFAANGFENYFTPIVNVAKTPHPTTGSVDGCNTCHDQLATTFHSGTRGGNIVVCRICHEVSSPGSHLEDQGRSIDSYVHGLHSFQAFDPGDIDFENPVEDLEYRHHISFTFPRFTIKNCEACHNTAIVNNRQMYDVPDQHMSMPGVLSGTDTIDGRDLQDIGPSVTGPAVRACGACHRAQAINADDSGELAIQITHWQTFGYYIETVAADVRALWEGVVEKIMALFPNAE